MNTYYGKFISADKIEFAPDYLVYGDKQYFNPPADILIAAGYKRIVYTPMPEEEPTEGMMWVQHFVDGDEITTVWEQEEIPPAPVPVPTPIEQLRADVDYIAMETGVEL